MLATTFLLLNACDGFNFRVDVERQTRAEALIGRVGADVVALNELNHWDEEDIAALAGRLGLPSAFLGRATESGYHLGALLRDPDARVVEMNASKPFHHGILQIRACLPDGRRPGCVDAVVAVTHLHPHSAQRRRLEAEAIALRAAEFALQGVPFVLLGDLNTLSTRDRAHVESDAVARVLASTPRLRRKFLVAAEAASEAGAVAPDYEPMRVLVEEGGLREIVTTHANCDAILGAKGGRTALASACAACTVPTESAADYMHAVPLRLDYALASGAVLGGDDALPPLGCVVHSVPPLSDHTALVVRLGAGNRAASASPREL
jgi:endonuclease/exonuclease/phosphatase (EEP) superfamily protein YafD